MFLNATWELYFLIKYEKVPSLKINSLGIFLNTTLERFVRFDKVVLMYKQLHAA